MERLDLLLAQFPKVSKPKQWWNFGPSFLSYFHLVFRLRPLIDPLKPRLLRIYLWLLTLVSLSSVFLLTSRIHEKCPFQTWTAVHIIFQWHPNLSISEPLLQTWPQKPSTFFPINLSATLEILLLPLSTLINHTIWWERWVVYLISSWERIGFGIIKEKLSIIASERGRMVLGRYASVYNDRGCTE